MKKTLNVISNCFCRQTRALGRYILELILQDYSLCQQPPSLLAVVTLEVADEVSSYNNVTYDFVGHWLVTGNSTEIERG